MKHKYHYNGPVKCSGVVVGHIDAHTIATTEMEALSNIACRYILDHKLAMGTKIMLYVTRIEEVYDE